MAEHDDLEAGYGTRTRRRFDELEDGLENLFEDNPRAFDEVLDDFASESANDDFIDGDFEDHDYLDDDFDSHDLTDSYGSDDLDDDFEYRSTPPGAFYRACQRELRRKPSTETDTSMVQDQATAAYTGRDRGPSYSL